MIASFLPGLPVVLRFRGGDSAQVEHSGAVTSPPAGQVGPCKPRNGFFLGNNLMYELKTRRMGPECV